MTLRQGCIWCTWRTAEKPLRMDRKERNKKWRSEVRDTAGRPCGALSTVKTLGFILCERINLWRVLSREMTQSDMSLKRFILTVLEQIWKQGEQSKVIRIIYETEHSDLCQGGGNEYDEKWLNPQYIFWRWNKQNSLVHLKWFMKEREDSRRTLQFGVQASGRLELSFSEMSKVTGGAGWPIKTFEYVRFKERTDIWMEMSCNLLQFRVPEGRLLDQSRWAVFKLLTHTGWLNCFSKDWPHSINHAPEESELSEIVLEISPEDSLMVSPSLRGTCPSNQAAQARQNEFISPGILSVGRYPF